MISWIRLIAAWLGLFQAGKNDLVLEVLAECRQPVSIVTKNKLVLRDLDLLKVNMSANAEIILGKVIPTASIRLLSTSTWISRSKPPRISTAATPAICSNL
jgi:hypothetical protein